MFVFIVAIGSLKGPKGLSVEGSKGYACDMTFTRGRMQHPDNKLDTIHTLGTGPSSLGDTGIVQPNSCSDRGLCCCVVLRSPGSVDEDMTDVALVALSFNRAYAPWLEQRYGLYLDPRRRRKDDWLLSCNDLGVEYQGGSIGAALAGGWSGRTAVGTVSETLNQGLVVDVQCVWRCTSLGSRCLDTCT